MDATAATSICIGEVNDLEYKDQSLAARRSSFSSDEEYNAMYEGLDHLYLDKSFFTYWAHIKGYTCIITDSPGNVSANTTRRFNVVINK